MGTYSNSTLIGNWSEERLKNDFDLQLFLRKRDRGELLLQKARILFSNSLIERPLKISGTFLSFGYKLQIVASDMPALIVNKKMTYGLALSALVDERRVDYTQQLSAGCLLTMSPVLAPCTRNTYTLVRVKQDSDTGESLRYGQDFLLQQANYGNESAPPLYVRYEQSGMPTPQNIMPIFLSAIPDTNCRWVAMPLYAKQNVELYGQPIEQGSKVILRNCVANKNLCVMNQSWMQTIFGPECGITVRTCMNHHKMVTAENVIKLVSDVSPSLAT